MNIVELIGFAITMLALSILYYRKMAEEKRRREHPEEFEEQEDEELAELQRFFGIEDEKKLSKKIVKIKSPPQPIPLPLKKPVQVPDLSYAFHHQQSSMAVDLIQSLKSKKQMVLYHEIIGRPKALKNDIF